MKKIIAALSMCIIFSLPSFAQVDEHQFILSLSPQVGIPLGDFGNKNSIGLGGSFIGELKISDRSRGLLSIGGYMFQGKTYQTDFLTEDTYPAIPLLQMKTGLKYFLSKNIFCSGQLGFARSMEKGEANTGFAYSPSVGIEFGNVVSYDVSVKYDVANIKTSFTDKISLVGLNVGFHF